MINLFFKNMQVYRLSRDFKIDTKEIESQLESFRFTPCGSQDMAKTGWVSPLGSDSERLHISVSDQMLFVIRREEKILPSAVVAEELRKKVIRLESDQGRKLRKTEKDALRDEVLHSLMPRAFSKNSTVRLWVNLKDGLIMVDAASARRAEDSLALLRKTLGSLPLVPLTMETPIELTITEWVRSGISPDGFALGDEAELKGLLAEGGVGRFKKQDLVSDEIHTHLDAGKVVTRLSLDWQSRIQFVLCDDGSIKRLKFADELTQQNDDIDREDVSQRLDADFILMAGELNSLISGLTDSLGGEAKR